MSAGQLPIVVAVEYEGAPGARLVAAAPDRQILLAAAEKFLHELDEGHSFLDWEAAKAELRAAVSRAKAQV